ncbi:hypothetical protein HPB48_019647 [Haemaphysalis longicornis]|uniref:C2H2-type domain-containing protein n=1 Tax=Haemaphysalis longicornis TaxID=44386 RepID=A0A9J6G2P8_HAELO|nr:hypothetical protein HPB48_019647 [Haemaphysalis longicornis]
MCRLLQCRVQRRAGPPAREMSGQPCPQSSLLGGMSVSDVVKVEGGDEVMMETTALEVASVDVMEVSAGDHLHHTAAAVETILVPEGDLEEVQFHGTVVQAVEEVQQVEDITAEVMASVDGNGSTVLCKVEPCEKSSEIWVLGDIITVDDQAHCILAEHVAAAGGGAMAGGSGRSSVEEEAALLSVGGGPRHACTDCNKEFTTVFHLRRHRRIHTGERPYPCKVCGQCFRHSTSLKVHMRRHTGEEPFMCSVCSKTFKDPANFKDSGAAVSTNDGSATTLRGRRERFCKLLKNAADAGRRFGECPRDGQVAPHNAPLKAALSTFGTPFEHDNVRTRSRSQHGREVHQNSHSKERPYACRVCEKRFNAASTLYAHMKIHTGERPYTCNICNRSFTFNNTLVRHIRTHTGEKPYKCELCPLRFSTASNLSSHRKKHAQERQFHCDICPQEFSTATALASHTKTHTGEHAHTCEVCSRGFAKFAGLQAHMRKHTGERAFHCEECGKSFTRKLHLRQHVQQEHEPVRPVATCEVCQRDFVNVESLQVHMKTHNVSRGTSAIVVYINKK